MNELPYKEDDLDSIFNEGALMAGRKELILTQLNDKSPCPCSCGHILPDDRRPRGMMAMIIPGGERSEFNMFIKRPGGLCYECYHACCRQPPEKWILSEDLNLRPLVVISPKYSEYVQSQKTI